MEKEKKHLGSWIEGRYCEVTECWCKQHGRHEGTPRGGSLYCEVPTCWCHHAAPWHETMQKQEKSVDPQELQKMLDFFLNPDDPDA